MELFGRSVSITNYLEEIRNFNSPAPEALPQRSNFEITDELSEARQINRRLYGKLKDRYRKETLFRDYANISGIYFFYSRSDNLPKYYYIGIATNLSDRFEDHLRRLDFIFYSLAYPQNIKTYYRDAIRFYADGKYASHKPEYDRQFNALETIGIEYIAWISSNEPLNWYEIESFLIAEFRPPVNDRKKTEIPKDEYKDDYVRVKDYFMSQFM